MMNNYLIYLLIVSEYMSSLPTRLDVSGGQWLGCHIQFFAPNTF